MIPVKNVVTRFSWEARIGSSAQTHARTVSTTERRPLESEINMCTETTNRLIATLEKAPCQAGVRMTKWEYNVIRLTGADVDINDALDMYGRAGWELVSVDQCRAYFKRPHEHQQNEGAWEDE